MSDASGFRSGAYYEIHVLVPHPTHRYSTSDGVGCSLRGVAREHGFSVSRIGLSESDDADDQGKLILTRRESREEIATEQVRELVEALRARGFNPSRYKVEHCVLDSNVADELGIGVGRRP
jgi:hypothetical protein